MQPFRGLRVVVIVTAGALAGAPPALRAAQSDPVPISAPEAAATDRYYAWALVSVHQSGAVTLNLSGFPDTGIGGPVYDLTNYDVPGATYTGNLQ